MKRKIEMVMTAVALATIIALTVITPKIGLGGTSDDIYLYQNNDGLLSTDELSAKRHPYRQAIGGDANGNVVSHKTGAHATVGAAYAARFQAYIDDLEAHGAVVRFMGGLRHGHCWSGGMHPCGKALDVCQLSRGRVDARCHLPNPSAISAIAAAHGLFEGGQWCHSDYGHAQVGVSAPACGGGTMLARNGRHTRTLAARSRRHYTQVASYAPVQTPMRDMAKNGW